MTSKPARLAITAARGYAALLASSAELGGQALRATAGEGADVARATAQALRAPDDLRSAAAERVLRVAYDAQRRQLHMMRGYAALFGMTFLNHFDAAQADPRDP